jgi:very-short-patch-repair endonuclease
LVSAGQDGVVTAAQCREAGLSRDVVQQHCRARRWLRLSRGAYLVDSEDIREPPRRAVIRASLLSAGPEAVAVLDTAAEVLGIAGLPRSPVVHVSVPPNGARPRRVCEPDARIHQFVLRPDEVMVVDGAAVTTPVRTLADLVLRVDRFNAVSLLDSALHFRFIVPEDWERIRASLWRRRGALRAAPWLAEADGRAESPLETRVRLRAVDGEVSPDELQYRVRDRFGSVIAIVDLAWVRAGVIGEADGVDAHDNPTAVFRDRQRQNAIVAAGFVPVRFTWADTLGPAAVPRLIRAAMTRRAS